MDLESIYCNTIKKHFKTYHANWLPGTPVELGDYGQVINGIFKRIGNIRQEGIADFTEILDETEDNYEFTSSNDTEFNFKLGGSVGPDGSVVKAGLEIKFHSANSVFLNSAGVKINSINNIRQVGEALIQADKDGRWKRPWAVVTTVLDAKATTIIVSGSADSSISLEATGDVPNVDLADASIGLRVARSNKLAHKQVAEKGLKPLLGLMKVKRGPFGTGPRDFKPFSLSQNMTNHIRALETEDVFWEFGRYEED